MRRRRGIMGLNGGAGIPVITATATGNPLTFETDLARPLKSLVIPFTPIQAAGTPSPDNPLPISGWTGCKTVNSPIPMPSIENGWRSGYITSGSNPKSIERASPTRQEMTSPYIPVIAGKNIVVSVRFSDIPSEGLWFGYISCRGDKTAVKSRLTATAGTVDRYSFTIAVPDNAELIRFSMRTYGIVSSLIWEYSDATNAITVDWQTEAGTIYGGTLTLNEDGSADLDVDWASKTVTSFSSVSSSSQKIDGEPTWEAYAYTSSDWHLGQIYSASTTYCDKVTVKVGSTTPSGVDAFWNVSAGNSASYFRIYIKESALDEVSKAGFNAWLSENQPHLVWKTRSTLAAYHFYNVGQLVTFLGTNTIWTDTNGTNTATYFKHQS